MESLFRARHRESQPDPNEELGRTELAVRQLERAELYVVSAIELNLVRWEQRQALHDLRCQLLEVRDLLRRPGPLD